MNNQKRILFVLDSLKYKENENVYKKEFSQEYISDFYYTDYENRLVRFLHGISGIGSFLSLISYWILSLISAGDLFLNKRKQYDSKVFINPIVGVFYCFLLVLFNKNDKVSIAGFLFVPKKNKVYFALRKYFVRFSYKKSSIIIVYSKSEVLFYSECFPTLALKFKFVRYGRDYDLFEKKTFKSETSYIASGGVSNRDYNTLACAMEILKKRQSDPHCKIVTRPGYLSLKCHPSNLEILYNIRIDAFGSFLKNSMFVVIPLKNIIISAGHMSLLEAMFRGKTILVTDIPSIRDYVDDEMVFFYKPDDPSDLADKIEYLSNNLMDKAVIQKSIYAKSVFLSTYCFIPFLKRIVSEVDKVM